MLVKLGLGQNWDAITSTGLLVKQGVARRLWDWRQSNGSTPLDKEHVLGSVSAID